MCGLVGMAGEIFFKDEHAFKTMLILDVVRGFDSTGVAAIPRDGNVKIAKAVGVPFDLFDTNVYERAMKGSHRVLIGHNRSATVGSITKQNAHPFEYGNIVGAHNGTLRNKHQLLNGNDFNVDSKALFNHIAEQGINSAIKNLDGAWALTWWDAEEQTINFLRNKERSLYICESKSGKTVYWASEAWMLNVALGRQDIEHTVPVLLEVNQHVKMVIDNKGTIVGEDTEEVKSEHVPFVTQQHGSHKNNVRIFGGHSKEEVTSVEEKKGSPAANASGLQQQHSEIRPTSYGGSRNRTLEVVSSHFDHNGSPYLLCRDLVNKEIPIRLYYHVKSQDIYMIGKQIIADISEKAYHAPATHSFYYKVEYSTIKLVVGVIDEEVEEDTPKIYGHDYKEIAQNDWYKRYGSGCGWCQMPVKHTDTFEYLRGGDGVLCEDCSKDDEVKRYIN